MSPVNPPCRLFTHRFALTALACSLAGFAALPLAAAPRPPILVTASGEARLELASGETVTARLPQGASLEATASLETGWLAAGTQPADLLRSTPVPASARDLLLLTGDGKTVSTLPAPPGKTGLLR